MERVVRIEELLGRPLGAVEKKKAPETIYCAGPMSLPLQHLRASIVGSRNASAGGLCRAEEIARVLAENRVTVVSGLARGIDTAAHRATMKSGGRTIAVIGTPLDRSYPAENHQLQGDIARNHLVASQFPAGHRTAPRDFVLRNLTMALISNVSIVAEARDGGGSLHHAREALRLHRPLLIPRQETESRGLEWPEEFTSMGAIIFDAPEDILEIIRGLKGASG